MAMAQLIFCRLLLGLGAHVLEVSHISRHIQHQLGLRKTIQQGTQVLPHLSKGHDQGKDRRTQRMTMCVAMAARMFNLSLVVPMKLFPLHALAFLATQRNT